MAWLLLATPSLGLCGGLVAQSLQTSYLLPATCHDRIVTYVPGQMHARTHTPTNANTNVHAHTDTHAHRQARTRTQTQKHSHTRCAATGGGRVYEDVD